MIPETGIIQAASPRFGGPKEPPGVLLPFRFSVLSRAFPWPRRCVSVTLRRIVSIAKSAFFSFFPLPPLSQV